MIAEHDAVSELIYRFRHFRFTNEEHAKEPEQIIHDSLLWFSSPRSLNDPHDCAPSFFFSDVPVAEQIERAKRMIERRQLGPRHPAAVKIMNNASEGVFNDPGFRDLMMVGAQAMIDESSVCCFTQTWEDPRMWAQYADNQRGYCVEFEFSDGWPTDAIPMPVEYVEERPRIDLSIDMMIDEEVAWHNARGAVLTKSKQWEGEREVRAFRPGIPAGLQMVPAGALKALYLGASIDDQNRQRLLAAAQGRSIAVYQLRPRLIGYGFNVEQLI